MLKVLSEPSATAVATAAFTGLRLGELRGLTWESYEPAQDQDSLGWLSVTRSVWRSTVGDPKTAKSKAPVPVIPQLARRLDAHRLKCGNPVAGPIFANSVGHPLDLNACYQREMKDVLKRAEISSHGWHGFRRGLASNLNRLGVDDSIQRILRHSTVATTQNHYIKTALPDAIAPGNIKGYDADKTRAFATPALLPKGIEGWLNEDFRNQKGNIHIHAKVIVVDFTTDAPVVISGSHNFSQPASSGNDENYLIIRGNRDVADYFGCELLRIYDHYRFRFVAKQQYKSKKAKAKGPRLTPDDSWNKPYFDAKDLKMTDRLRFTGL